MKTVSIREAKNRLTEFARAVEEGERRHAGILSMRDALPSRKSSALLASPVFGKSPLTTLSVGSSSSNAKWRI